LPEAGFILVTGTVKIFDYDTISNMAKYWDKLDEAFNPPKTDTARKARKKSDPYHAIRNLEVIISAFFKDTIRVRVTSYEGSSYIGPLSREHFREDRRNLIYKHGSQPKGDWSMLAEISRRPSHTESPGNRLKQLMGSEQSPQEQQNSSPSEMINDLVDRFDAFQELIDSASILDVHVSPIAIYREVHPYEVTQRED
jgi:hypothetical protein